MEKIMGKIISTVNNPIGLVSISSPATGRVITNTNHYLGYSTSRRICRGNDINASGPGAYIALWGFGLLALRRGFLVASDGNTSTLNKIIIIICVV